MLTFPSPLSHRDLQAWRSKGPSQRNHRVINLISEARLFRLGEGWEWAVFILAPAHADSRSRPQTPEFCPFPLSFHPEVKGVKISLFLLVFPRSLNSWGLLIILKCRAFPGSLPPGVAPHPRPRSLFSVPREKPATTIWIYVRWIRDTKGTIRPNLQKKGGSRMGG